VGKKDKKQDKGDEEIVDLASRIGGRLPEPVAPPPPPPPAPADARPTRLDGPLPPRRSELRERPMLIGGDEPPPPPLPSDPNKTDAERAAAGAIQSPRTPPGPNETDLVITPIPTLDDWHKFELALRKVRGVGQVKTEYYRHGVLKVRVSFEGEGRLAQALRVRGVPGYRVRVLGEDQTTLQILVSTDNDERRPG
jgi:hypothetical protein